MVGLPTPQALLREEGPTTSTPLHDLAIEVSGGPLATPLLDWLPQTGASLVDHQRSVDPQAEPVHGLVFDATGVRSCEELKALYSFFHPRIRQLARCGRVVVMGRRSTDADAIESAAVCQALLGFTKSLAKELGRRGATANLLTVGEGCEQSLRGPLCYLLSRRSVFVTGQALDVQPARVPLAGMGTDLTDRVAVVTGASRGIGRATAVRLAEQGARVYCLDLPDQAEALESLAEEVSGVSLPLDITSESAASAIHQAVGGTLDILVHNAGITRDKTLARMTEAFWEQAIHVNLVAVHRVTAELLQGETLSPQARIVLVSSIAGIAGNLGQTNYAASKAGVIGLTQAWGQQLQSGTRAINAVAPGFVETRLTAAIPFTIREGGRRLSNLGQGGQPRDIADAITFLASPQSTGLNGSVLRVCGGSYVGA